MRILDVVCVWSLLGVSPHPTPLTRCSHPVGDMWSSQDGEEEPEWVASEREQFTTMRDTNKDGKMDKEEVRDWIIPTDYDHSDAEAKHLVRESDKDGVR